MAGNASVTPMGGWLLDRAVELDLQISGFAGHVLRASAERRHVIAAFLAARRTFREFDSLAECGQFLMVSRHQEILRAAYGQVPRHFCAVLRRCDAQPLPRRIYGYIRCILSSRSRPETVTLLLNLNKVTAKRLRIARRLTPEIRFANLVELIRDDEEASDLSDAFARLIDVGVSGDAMIQSLKTISTAQALRRFARHFGLQAPLPAHPVPATPFYQPVTSGRDLDTMAREFRNCSRNYLANVLEARSTFAVISIDGRQAVAHLLRRSDRWVLDDIYGKANNLPSPNIEAAVTDYLRGFGIVRRNVRSFAGEWRSLRRIAGHFDYDVD